MAPFDPIELEGLIPYAVTERQIQFIRESIACGSGTAAAKKLKVDQSAVARAIQRVRNRATRQGYAPGFVEFPIPEGQKLTGTSTLVKSPDGGIQWIKTSEDQSRKEQMLNDIFLSLSETLPRYNPVPAPVSTLSDLITTYVITDYHMGMLAWSEETGGDDWDLKIAEDTLMHWFSVAIERAPNSSHCVFAQLGDFLHWDGLDAVTPAHGNLLDADTRFQKLIRVVIRVLRRIISMLAAKHDHVHVIMADANHDPASGAWLREWLFAVYEDDPRITVDTSADSYYCVEHGKTSLFFHHGHKRKLENVDDVFAAKFREIFGRTKYSYAHLGHLHSNALKETPLMQVERHRTLAAADAYAAKGGWVSGRDAKVITYHREYGECERLIINPDMLKAH